VAALLFPLLVVKVPINLLILKVGAQRIARLDVSERRKKKEDNTQ